MRNGCITALLITSSSWANAQSKDRDNPTPLTSNEIAGVIGGNLGDDYYYTFVAGSGELTITLSVEAGREAGLNFNTVNFDLFDKDARKIASKSQSAGSGHTEQGIVRVQLNRRQRLLLRISIPESNYGYGAGNTGCDLAAPLRSIKIRRLRAIASERVLVWKACRKP